MSDYLFDKEGAPDPDVEQLEGLLGALAYQGAPPRLPARRSRRTLWVAAGLSAIAASLVALLMAAPWRSRGAGAATAAWAATVRDGAATIDGRPTEGAARLPVGAWLETGDARVQLVVAGLGSLELAPATRARIVASGPMRHELQLARGTLAAVIVAPPRHFVVSTARAVVTDLGCAFEITVDEAGRGRLRVTEGRVAVSDRGAAELVIAAGAGVALADNGPGLPFLLGPAPPGVPPLAPTPPPTPAQTTVRAASPTSPTPAQTTERAASPTSPTPAQTTERAASPTTKRASGPSSKAAAPQNAPPRRAPHATTAPSGARPSGQGQAQAPVASPTRPPAPPRPAPAARVEHNPLKALEHSVE